MAYEFLGTGWSFPVKIDKNTGKMKTSSREDDIKEAIKIILGTRKGERVMRPNFGCNIGQFIYETMDDTTLFLIEEEVKESVLNWEPRIEDINVKAIKDERSYGKININVSYRVRRTNNLFNLVYPFYLKEGVR